MSPTRKLTIIAKLDHQQKLLEELRKGPEGMHTSINWHAYSIDRLNDALCEVISVMREHFVGPMRTFPTASEERPERELVVGNKAAHEPGKSRLRKFRSHKIVEAEVIYSTMPPGHVPYVTVVHSPPHAGLERVPVPAAFFARGTPMPGDYLVRYSDGYLSWSPKKAFEEGYTEIAEPADPSTSSTQDADARDAARWRALMASPRMHWMGSAGFVLQRPAEADPANSVPLQQLTPTVPKGAHLHFVMEFWSDFPDHPEHPDVFERKLLEAYADEMVRRLAEKKDKD